MQELIQTSDGTSVRDNYNAFRAGSNERERSSQITRADFSTLYSFCSKSGGADRRVSADGTGPGPAMGNLYGTTILGGVGGAYGSGTILRTYFEFWCALTNASYLRDKDL